jgi:hypothetical protein
MSGPTYRTYSEWKALSFDGHSPNMADPMFASYPAADFRLQAGSPAIDRGTVANISSDIDGSSRPFGNGFDIGAYESGSTPTLAPPLNLRLVPN